MLRERCRLPQYYYLAIIIHSKNAGLFQPMFGSDVGINKKKCKPNGWVCLAFLTQT